MTAQLPTLLSVVFEVRGILDDLEIRYHLGDSFAGGVMSLVFFWQPTTTSIWYTLKSGQPIWPFEGY
jgi:hypothetical protein